MNRGMTDDPILKFISGAMGPEEEHAFLLRMEREPALRRAVDAERTITRTLLIDRAALPPAPPGGRRHLLDMLGRQAMYQAGGRGGSWIARLFGGGAMKGIAIAAAVGVSATVAIVKLNDGPATERGGDRGAPSIEPATPRASAPANASAPAPANAPASASASAPASTPMAAPSAPATSPADARRTEAAPRSDAPRESIRSGSDRRVEARASTSSAAAQSASASSASARPTEGTGREDAATRRQTPEASAPTVIVTDSMRVPVRIDLGKVPKRIEKNDRP